MHAFTIDYFHLSHYLSMSENCMKLIAKLFSKFGFYVEKYILFFNQRI